MAEERYFLRGEVDLDEAPHVRAELMAAAGRGRDLIVDCSGLQFIDSTGIAMLLEANRELEAAGRHMLIANVPSGPRRVFEVLGLNDLLRHDREPAA